MKCELSKVECQKCDKNPNCPIYSERYVLMKQLKKLRNVLDETQTILKAVLRVNNT